MINYICMINTINRADSMMLDKNLLSSIIESAQFSSNDPDL